MQQQLRRGTLPWFGNKMRLASQLTATLNIIWIGWIADAFVASTPGSLLRSPWGGSSHSPRSVDSGRGIFISSPESIQQEGGFITRRVSRHNLEECNGREFVKEVVSCTTSENAWRCSNDELDKVATTTAECLKGCMASFRLFVSGPLCSSIIVSTIMIASTTEEDIMSAMSGLSIDEVGQERLALVAPAGGIQPPSDSSPTAGPSGGRGSSRAAAGVEERQKGNMRGREQDLGVGLDNDLMRTLQERSVRQAGPLTHGF